MESEQETKREPTEEGKPSLTDSAEMQRAAAEFQMLAGDNEIGYVDLVIVDINSKEIPLRVRLTSIYHSRLPDERSCLSSGNS